MSIQDVRTISSIPTPDDQQFPVLRRDLSGGVNTRQHPSMIAENQMTVLNNIDIGVSGQALRRAGSVQVGGDIGASAILGLCNFKIQGDTDQLLAYMGTDIYKWEGTGTWAALGHTFSSTTEVGFVVAKQSGNTPDDVVIVQNGVDNAHLIMPDGSIEDLGDTAIYSIPKSTVMCWYGNRVWVLLNDNLAFSDAYPASYADTDAPSTAWDTVTNIFRVPVGAERGLCATRDTGIIVMGEDAIWGVAPSVVPAVTDKPEPLITNHGVVSKNGWCQAGDDIYYFAQDGFRALKRTIQDKLQAGVEFPISYALKDEFEKIAWEYISRLSMKYFDNKIFINVPTGANTFDTWVYYTAMKSFVIYTGWSPRCWETYKVSGELGLYYGQYSDGNVFQALVGYTDEGTSTINGTAITYTEEGREEDAGQPLVKKEGGFVKVEAASSGDWDLDVYASFDGEEYEYLGQVNLKDNSPTLPVDLPFYLTAPLIKRKIFHLDPYGAWYTIKLKIECTTTTASDDIKLYTRGFVTYMEMLQEGEE